MYRKLVNMWASTCRYLAAAGLCAGCSDMSSLQRGWPGQWTYLGLITAIIFYSLILFYAYIFPECTSDPLCGPGACRRLIQLYGQSKRVLSIYFCITLWHCYLVTLIQPLLGDLKSYLLLWLPVVRGSLNHDLALLPFSAASLSSAWLCWWFKLE